MEDLNQNNLEQIVENISQRTNYQDELIDSLSGIIQELLHRDVYKLLNALYRIDVEEQKVKKALIHENTAHELAQLVIKRLQEKAELRKKYNNYLDD